MAKSFEFYYDVGSPAAYLAWTQLGAIEAATGATAVHKPMLLGGVFQATSNQSPMAVPAKGSYMMVDLQRFAQRYGVPFNHNPHFPINTLMLMRGAAGLLLGDAGRYADYLEAVFRAIWVDAKNMNDPATVASVLDGAGFDAMALLSLTVEPEVKELLKQATQQAVARGVFGAPTFFVGDQMFWGQDRIDFVKEALK